MEISIVFIVSFLAIAFGIVLGNIVIKEKSD